MYRVIVRQTTLLTIAALLTLSFAFAACGSDSLSGGERAAMVADLTSDGLTEDEANCFIDELGSDAKRLWESAEGGDDDLSDEDFVKLLAAFVECAEE